MLIIGLVLSQCIHKKLIKSRINSILLPMFATYSYILYFVIFSVTPGLAVGFCIHQNRVEVGLYKVIKSLQAGAVLELIWGQCTDFGDI